jgi:signal transduction histidine kinase
MLAMSVHLIGYATKSVVLNESCHIQRMDSCIYEYTESGAKELPISKVINSWESGKFEYVNKKMPAYWMSPNAHWLTFSIKSRIYQVVVLELNNSLIGEIDAYLQNNDTTIQLPQAGYNSSIEQRVYNSYKNCYRIPLLQDSVYRIYLRVKRSEGTLKIPLVLWGENNFLTYNYHEYFKYGFFAGLILFISLFCLIIYFNIKDKKYLYYALYCLSVLAWRSIVEGFLISFFQTNIPYFSNPIWANIFIVFSGYFAMLFLRHFILNEFSPKWHYWFNSFTQYFVLFFLLYISVFNQKVTHAIALAYNLMVLSIVLNLIVFTYHGIKRKQINAYIYLIGILPTIVYVSVVTLTDFLELPTPYYLYDSFLFVLLFDIITLSVGLAIDFKNRVTRQNQALIDLNIQQTENFEMRLKLQNEELKVAENAVILKNEKERISRDLHDSIGTDLSNIIYNIEHYKNKYHQTIHVFDDFTNLSHTVKHAITQLRGSIWVLNKEYITLSMFVEKIQNHIHHTFDALSAIKFSLKYNTESEEKIIPPMHSLYLYRMIQECLGNAIKHSNASELYLELTYLNNQIRVYFADNGKGFNTEQEFTSESYGLKNMKKRAKELSGTIDIRSSSYGTIIIIILPVNKIS